MKTHFYLQKTEAKTFKEWIARIWVLEGGMKSCGYCSCCMPMVKAVKISTCLLVVREQNNNNYVCAIHKK